MLRPWCAARIGTVLCQGVQQQQYHAVGLVGFEAASYTQRGAPSQPPTLELAYRIGVVGHLWVAWAAGHSAVRGFGPRMLRMETMFHLRCGMPLWSLFGCLTCWALRALGPRTSVSFVPLLSRWPSVGLRALGNLTSSCGPRAVL